MKVFQPQYFPNIKRFELKSSNQLALMLYILFGILSLGLFWIIAYWFDDLYFLFYGNEDQLEKTDYILFTRQDDSKFLIPLQKQKCQITLFEEPTFFMFFRFQGQLFYFNEQKQFFEPSYNEITQCIINPQINLNMIQNGLEKQKVKNLQLYYGRNEMIFETNSFITQFGLEFIRPINFAQFLIGVAFIFINRLVYSMTVMGFVFVTVYLSSLEYIQSARKLQQISQHDSQVTVIRNFGGEIFQEQISSKELVVGDIIVLQKDQIFSCDLIVIYGSCLVNEALLTGESIPILKSAYEFEGQNIKESNKLMGGTFLVHKKTELVLAMVIGTGWNTAKGKLLGSVVYSQQATDKFKKDFLKVLLIFSFFNAFIIVLYFLVHFNQQYFSWQWILPYILDIAKNCFPPVLFFTMQLSIQLSSQKLLDKKIYSLKTSKILEGGAVKQICFDKTGTLTNLEIKIYGYIIREGEQLESFGEKITQFQHLENYKQIMEGIVICHALEQIEDTYVGDPLEEVMFAQTNAQIQIINHPFDDNKKANSIMLSQKISKQLNRQEEERFIQLEINEFTSQRKRMSVVSLDQKNNEISIFCKGAPETIKKLCKKETIPNDFDDVLKNFSQQGYRILALGSKKLDNYEYDQNSEKEEKNMEFLGFLLFENSLKNTTKDTIQKLKANLYQVCMITGDNIFTAENVGYASGIISQKQQVYQGILKNDQIVWEFQDKNEQIQIKKSDVIRTSLLVSRRQLPSVRTINVQYTLEQIIQQCKSSKNCLALTGDCFQKICEDYKINQNMIFDVLDNTLIYARSSAQQKELIINKYKKRNEKISSYVAFVGDGANDALALKTANIGLSIGNDDSSYSASFFTPNQHIQPLENILIESKVCLGNSFQTFFYITLILNFSNIHIFINSFNNWNFINFDYVFINFYMFPFAFCMLYSQTNEKLNYFKQSQTLYNVKQFINYVFQLLGLTLISLYLFFYMNNHEITKSQNQITDEANDPKLNRSNYFFVESKLIYLIHPILVMCQSFISYQGMPFKRPYWTNISLLICLIITTFMVIIQLYGNCIFRNFQNFLKFVNYYMRIPHYYDDYILRYSLIVIVSFSIYILVNKIARQKYFYDQVNNKSKNRKNLENIIIENKQL